MHVPQPLKLKIVSPWKNGLLHHVMRQTLPNDGSLRLYPNAPENSCHESPGVTVAMKLGKFQTAVAVVKVDTDPHIGIP